MPKWEPRIHHADPMVNAVLNVAEQLGRLATATNGLLYGLKYSKADGLSIAEAIDVAGKAVAQSVSELQQAVADLGSVESAP